MARVLLVPPKMRRITSAAPPRTRAGAPKAPVRKYWKKLCPGRLAQTRAPTPSTPAPASMRKGVEPLVKTFSARLRRFSFSANFKRPNSSTVLTLTPARSAAESNPRFSTVDRSPFCSSTWMRLGDPGRARAVTREVRMATATATLPAAPQARPAKFKVARGGVATAPTVLILTRPGVGTAKARKTPLMAVASTAAAATHPRTGRRAMARKRKGPRRAS
mmetsp:Transcript_20060/g.37729  ORF Transcript_20060/g.37729 Transcript_20060/m.37729 type:complete len:219 (+) Transcript_20060:533-1189(+)